ncbi:glycyl-radical enzyme activating protein [Lacticaseibacillus casei]|uniref:glycyl-radical enzyme activating protein n=1 Tax=Lacticaseibacillus casei TaxID=1582 RepID=UPI001109FDBB|nr:glycyl-radical enzyme activating protein [Lacticaseibacillus casei]TLQ50439.1 glycyl-radical enzyme activating protein [Lacticaseibacillus casei]
MSNELGLVFNIQKFSLNDGPGIRTVVFFKGCPLRCKWCSNPESQSGKPEPMYDESKQRNVTVGRWYTVDDVMKIIVQDMDFYEESGGGVTLSGGEILFQPTFVTALAKACHNASINVACETTGYANPKVFTDLAQYIDLMYYDCKQWDSDKHRAGTNARNELILKNLQTAIQMQKLTVRVRIPVIPGFNYSDDDARHFGELFNRIHVPEVELLPFHQFGLKKYEDLHREYALKDVKQLQTSDLESFQEILQQAGIKATINGW